MSRTIGETFKAKVKETGCFHYYVNGVCVLITKLDTRYIQINCFGLWNCKDTIETISRDYEIYIKIKTFKNETTLIKFNQKKLRVV